jgi:hypothetical protein
MEVHTVKERHGFGHGGRTGAQPRGTQGGSQRTVITALSGGQGRQYNCVVRVGLRATQIRDPHGWRPRRIGTTCADATADWKDIVLKRILAPLVAMAALFVIGVPIARAAAIEISIDTVVTAPEGSITMLAKTDIPPELIGMSCISFAEATNQPSIHQGNDLIVTSGDSSIVLEDVERAPGAVTTAEGVLALGPSATVSLRMGPDEIFSGGLVFIIGECATPTTTTEPATTTTQPTTTSTQALNPAIVIEKLANPVEYGDDGIGHFTIRVTNPGPVILTNVNVADDAALAIDPSSTCPNPVLPDLAVDEYYEYDCTVANLDGVSPYTNEATAIGTGPEGTEVTDTDDAVVFPPVLATTITQPPPTTTPAPTLPNTGVPYEKMRGVSMAGFAFFVGGVALLSVAALVGRLQVQQTTTTATGQHEVWLTIETRPRGRTIYIPLRPAGGDPGSPDRVIR